MKKLLLLFAISLIIQSCQTSKITKSWSDKDLKSKKYTRVLVLGVFRETDSSLQVKMENHLAKDLKELGYSAFAANEIFPSGTFIKGDTVRARKVISSYEFDAVLTIVLLDKVKEKYYVPGKMVYTPYAGYVDRFDQYYSTMSDRIHTEGYYATETKIFWESNFYDVNEKKLVYSAQTRSFDPGSKETLAHFYGLLLVNNLVKKKILKEPPVR